MSSIWCRNYTIIPPWIKALHLKKNHLISLISRVFGWNWPCSSLEKDFYFHQYILAISVISPLKETWPFIWTKISCTFCVKCDWNWLSRSCEEGVNKWKVYSLTDRRTEIWSKIGDQKKSSIPYMYYSFTDHPLIEWITRQASADSFLITPRPCDVKRHWTGLFLGLI